MNYYVYQLRRSDRTEPFYIGKGRGRRIYGHFTDGRLKHNSHKNQTIKKAMSEGIPILKEFMFIGCSETQSFIMENKLIEFWGRSDQGLGPLTNMTDGGEGSSGCRKPNSMKGKTYESMGLKHPGPKFKPGEHPEFGKKPWDCARVRNNPEILQIWTSAQDLYEKWISLDKCGCKALSKEFKLKPHATMNMIDKFKIGWIPNQDDNWLDFSQKLAA